MQTESYSVSQLSRRTRKTNQAKSQKSSRIQSGKVKVNKFRDEDEENREINYDDLNDEFGNVSVSGKCLTLDSLLYCR